MELKKQLSKTLPEKWGGGAAQKLRTSPKKGRLLLLTGQDHLPSKQTVNTLMSNLNIKSNEKNSTNFRCGYTAHVGLFVYSAKYGTPQSGKLLWR